MSVSKEMMNVSPFNCRRLVEAYRIVHNLAFEPDIPTDHPLATASSALAYLVGYFSAEIQETLGDDPLLP
jgi:hypothetical protein